MTKHHIIILGSALVACVVALYVTALQSNRDKKDVRFENSTGPVNRTVRDSWNGADVNITNPASSNNDDRRGVLFNNFVGPVLETTEGSWNTANVVID